MLMMNYWYIWHTDCLMLLVDNFKLVAHRWMFSFFYGKLCCPPPSTGSGKNRILCATSDDLFQIFGYIIRCWVAMELPCEICTAKMPSKSKLIEIGGRCFLGSASMKMAKTHMLGWKGFGIGHWGLHWVRWDPHRIIACVFLVAYYHWQKDSHTSSMRICIESAGSALSAGGAKHGSLHQGIFRCIINGYSSVPVLHVARPALIGIPLVDKHMEKKLANVQEAM
jgi:hypothetical protein